MVSKPAIDAIRKELSKAKRRDGLAYARDERRLARRRLQRSLSPTRLSENRNGVRFAGLRKVLEENLITSPRLAGLVLARIRASPAALRRWAKVLLDTRLPRAQRLAVVQDERSIHGIGRDTYSMLLHLREPAEFGVLNSAAEHGLRTLGLWPERFPRGFGNGDRYLAINNILHELADHGGLRTYKDGKLAILDALLWRIGQDGEGGNRGSRAPKRRRGLAPGDPDAAPSGAEGGKRLVEHVRAERNAKLVNEIKGCWMGRDPYLPCAVCGFSFWRGCGEALGRGFVEAHHKRALARRHRKGLAGLSDFDQVCSNCHRMLHRMGVEMDVSRLRAIIARNRRTGS